MRLTDASVAIRPRSAWEAVDLGILLARRHAALLMASWALLTLPIFALISLLLWSHPSWAILLFWLGKPAYERLPLYILSRALFRDTPRLGQALRAWPGLLRRQLASSLLWRRLSPTRSFDLPVLQLEGLSGTARQQRLAVLGQRDSGCAVWLTLVGMLLEGALLLGLISLFYLLLPAQLMENWDWKKLLQESENEWLWLEHLSNLLYALVLVVWEPIYVACGFTLYLNRRTHLEGWDIELAFRRLRQRLTGVAYALLLASGLLLSLPAPPAWAEAEPAAPADFDPLGPQAERLQQQKLSSKAAHQAITTLLDNPPFEHRETVTRWKFERDDKAKDEDQEGQLRESSQALGRLFDYLEQWQVLAALAHGMEILLWALLAALLALLLWRYREWLQNLVGQLGPPRRRTRQAPSVMFGLELAPESLPDDIAGNVERLWDSQPREALGLLYRALLSRLLHDLRIPLKSSHTENEVLVQLAVREQGELLIFSEELTRHWQNLAYGHRLPPGELRDALCGTWRRLFPGKVLA